MLMKVSKCAFLKSFRTVFIYFFSNKRNVAKTYKKKCLQLFVITQPH